jgi:NH3-dependent NAD+ synthetase
MQPELTELLVGGFTVAVNGHGMGTYAPTESNMKQHVKALTETCKE